MPHYSETPPSWSELSSGPFKNDCLDKFETQKLREIAPHELDESAVGDNSPNDCNFLPSLFVWQWETTSARNRESRSDMPVDSAEHCSDSSKLEALFGKSERLVEDEDFFIIWWQASFRMLLVIEMSVSLCSFKLSRLTSVSSTGGRQLRQVSWSE